MIKKTITAKKVQDKAKFTRDSIEVINKLIENRNEINFEFIQPAKARSNKQNAYYWKNVLRLIAEYCDGMGDYVINDPETNKIDYTPLHRYLTILFCVENNRPDLCETYKTYRNKEFHDVLIASFSFEKMKADDATAYISWLENKFKQRVGGVGFDEMLQREKMEVQ